MSDIISIFTPLILIKNIIIMAIYGAGSKWDILEMKDHFFKYGIYEIGWNYSDAADLYELAASLKVSDIIYLKSNKPGSSDIKVKGIGVVIKSYIQCLNDKERISKCSILKNSTNFYIEVKWLHKTEFHINIPIGEGKLTNIRAATFYEECLPFVKKEIMNKIF